MTIAFEYAHLNDLNAIVSTYNSTIPGRMVTADLEPVRAMDKLQWFNAHNKKSRPLWRVNCNAEYAGWMSFSSFYGRPAYDGTVEVSIYLEEKFRGKGVGKACLDKAIQDAPKMKIHTLLGFIFGHNDASLKLFYQFNFQKWAQLPGVANMDGVMRDLVILGRKV
jgi:L-amino acid N-acyltransferase YncA